MIMWEKKPVLLIILATCAILVGTIVTMVLPFAWINTEADRIEGVTPYTALQQEGRDVYIREGCNNCHTQTVRPLVSDVLRYGEYSKSGEFVYDRPFLWGSKRTGRTWHASAANTRMHGTTSTWTLHAPWFQKPTCLTTSGFGITRLIHR